MNFLSMFVLILSLETGIVPEGEFYHGIDINDYKNYVIDFPGYIIFSADLHILKFIFIRGNYTSVFYPLNSNYDPSDKGIHIRFIPDYDTFIFSGGFRFENSKESDEFIEIGIEHMCTHPLFPYIAGSYNPDNYSPEFKIEKQGVISIFEGSMTKAYLKFQAKLGN